MHTQNATSTWLQLVGQARVPSSSLGGRCLWRRRWLPPAQVDEHGRKEVGLASVGVVGVVGVASVAAGE